MVIIGDVHGKIDKYWKLLQNYRGESIQAGDFGFKKEHQWHLKNIDNSRHKVCFGNHDCTDFLNSPHSCGNYSYRPDMELMTIRGAWSIDKWMRIEGKDWWRDEEMSDTEMRLALDFYDKKLPSIVVSHDCPNSVRGALFSVEDKTTTSNYMQAMLELHQPDLWVFGHWHKSIDVRIDGTRFVCLNELEVINV